MSKKQILYLLLGLLIASYAYCFDGMLVPSMFLSMIALIISITSNIDVLFSMKHNIEKSVFIFVMIVIFKVIGIEDIFVGITFITTINIFVSSQIVILLNRRQTLLKDIVTKASYVYMLFTLLTIILPNTFIYNSRFLMFTLITCIFLPIIFYFVLSCLECYVYVVRSKKDIYDTVSNK